MVLLLMMFAVLLTPTVVAIAPTIAFLMMCGFMIVIALCGPTLSPGFCLHPSARTLIDTLISLLISDAPHWSHLASLLEAYALPT